MATKYREIVYMVLDEIKSLGGDSLITEEHVLFLANHYRMVLLENKIKEKGESSLSQSNFQTLCVNLEQTEAIPGLEYCNDTYLRSVEKVPDTLNGTKVNVYPVDYFNTKIAYVSKDRFKYVGHNKYMKNIIYCTLGPDDRLYFSSSNPQFLYMEQAKVNGLFEDSEKAAELSCETDGEETKTCDLLDKEFPLDSSLIPILIQQIVKELYGAAYRPADTANNAADDLADLVSYINKHAKSQLAKQIAE